MTISMRQLASVARRKMTRFFAPILLVAAPFVVIFGGAEATGAPNIPIMSQARLSSSQLVAWFKASTGSPYRATVPIETLASYYIVEGQRAGVRGDIAFAQSVLETAWFSFPDAGYIRAGYNNFAGIGAFGPGLPCGAPTSNVKCWATAQLGVRAQMQLLRRYADPNSTQYNIGSTPVPELWNPASKFDYPGGTHGWAPTWQSLSGTWASSTTYSEKILALYDSALRLNGQPTGCPPQRLAIGSGARATQGCSAGEAMPGRAVASRAAGGYYVLNGNGAVTAGGGAPGGNGPLFGWDIARDIAVMPDGAGYVVLDGWGGLHRFGSATSLPRQPVASYWRGWDIARRVAITSTGAGVGILDGWGGLHSAGDAPTEVAAYWSGWDIARGLAFTPDNLGTYVLDGWGGVHTAGSATYAGAPYWFGWDIARDIETGPGGAGYAVLAAFGSIHGFGGAPSAGVPGYVAADVWRGVSVEGAGYRAVRNDGVTQTP